jgi:hypothetical protein
MLGPRSMDGRQTGVNIVRASREGDVTTTELWLQEGAWPSAPLAPATVWSGDVDRLLLIELHRLVDLEGASARFESYELETALPPIGGPHSFFAWWTPEQLAAAIDPSLEWQPVQYYESDHGHCRLTWKEIEPGDPVYVSDAGWITVEAYERYIRDDVLRVRAAPPAACESPRRLGARGRLRKRPTSS